MSKRRPVAMKNRFAGTGVSLALRNGLLYARLGESDLWDGKEVEVRELMLLATKPGDRVVQRPGGGVEILAGKTPLGPDVASVTIVSPGRAIIGVYPRDRTLDAVMWEDSREQMSQLFELDLRRRGRPVPSRVLTSEEVTHMIKIPLATTSRLADVECAVPGCGSAAADACTGCDTRVCRAHSHPCEVSPGSPLVTLGFCKKCLVIAGLSEP